MRKVEDALHELGLDSFFEYQEKTFAKIQAQHGPQRPLRHCLYYRTGAGKTITALVGLWLLDIEEVLVITPPITQEQWVSAGERLGIRVEAISHAKFRQKNYRPRRDVAVVVDEFHLLGGHSGQGWKKLDRLAPHLQAPLMVLSATPNYNAAERVYCVMHTLDPHSAKGGFLQFLYTHCETEQNPFAQTPNVTGFLRFDDAEQFLASLPYVSYVPDELKMEPTDVQLTTLLPSELFVYGVHRRKEKMVASGMEGRHAVSHDQLVAEDGYIHEHIMDELIELVGNVATPTLMFCATATVARALYRTCKRNNANVGIVTGQDTTKQKQFIVDQFKLGYMDALIGTSTLATGTDGLDKMCDQLIIVQDTDDDAQRRQLIGRITPRGADADVSRKQVIRLVVSS